MSDKVTEVILHWISLSSKFYLSWSLDQIPSHYFRSHWFQPLPSYTLTMLFSLYSLHLFWYLSTYTELNHPVHLSHYSKWASIIASALSPWQNTKWIDNTYLLKYFKLETIEISYYPLLYTSGSFLFFSSQY